MMVELSLLSCAVESDCVNPSHCPTCQPTAPLSDDGSKKIGVLYIVNQLFSMYFTLNTLRLCKNLLKPVESRKLHLSGNKGDLVTYRYFVGRLMMFEDQYETAEENLEYALKHCHKKAINNKRSILRYLVPVKLYRGRLPTLALLQKYGLNEFLPLVEGMRRGDLRTFNEGLNLYQDLFIRCV
jgi:nuclear mRNA export protein PCID2/THP1